MNKDLFKKVWATLAIGTVAAVTFITGAPLVPAVASLSGIVFVVGIAFGWKWSNLFGAILAGCLAYLSYTAGFYGNTLVQGVFVLPASLYGLWYWLNNQGADGVKKRSLSKTATYNGSLASVVLFAVAVAFSINTGANLPILDAATFVLPIIGTYLLINAYKEQWLVWIISNAVQAYMWIFAATTLSTDFIALATMKVVFLVNSVIGFYFWYKETK